MSDRILQKFVRDSLDYVEARAIDQVEPYPNSVFELLLAEASNAPALIAEIVDTGIKVLAEGRTARGEPDRALIGILHKATLTEEQHGNLIDAGIKAAFRQAAVDDNLSATANMVGMLVAVSQAADEHEAALEAGRAIMQIYNKKPDLEAVTFIVNAHTERGFISRPPRVGAPSQQELVAG